MIGLLDGLLDRLLGDRREQHRHVAAVLDRPLVDDAEVGDILGDKEEEAGGISVRRHGEGDLGALTVREFAERAAAEVVSRA